MIADDLRQGAHRRQRRLAARARSARTSSFPTSVSGLALGHGLVSTRRSKSRSAPCLEWSRSRRSATRPGGSARICHVGRHELGCQSVRRLQWPCEASPSAASRHLDPRHVLPDHQDPARRGSPAAQRLALAVLQRAAHGCRRQGRPAGQPGPADGAQRQDAGRGAVQPALADRGAHADPQQGRRDRSRLRRPPPRPRPAAARAAVRRALLPPGPCRGRRPAGPGGRPLRRHAGGRSSTPPAWRRSSRRSSAALDEVVRPRNIVARNDAPSAAARGPDARRSRRSRASCRTRLELVENGLTFVADPGGGQKTGWFYDQRANRRFAAPVSRAARTCSTSTATAAASRSPRPPPAPRSVTAVDSSAAALELAAASAAPPGQRPSVATFERAEAFAFLDRAAAEQEPLRPGDRRPAGVREEPQGSRRRPQGLPQARPHGRRRGERARLPLPRLLLAPRHGRAVRGRGLGRHPRRRPRRPAAAAAPAPARTTRSIRRCRRPPISSSSPTRSTERVFSTINYCNCDYTKLKSDRSRSSVGDPLGRSAGWPPLRSSVRTPSLPEPPAPDGVLLGFVRLCRQLERPVTEAELRAAVDAARDRRRPRLPRQARPPAAASASSTPRDERRATLARLPPPFLILGRQPGQAWLVRGAHAGPAGAGRSGARRRHAPARSRSRPASATASSG